jgi:tetratricopeptide (TPR) repeat protein
MGRHDWYRNTEWSEEIEISFRDKLSRSRSQKSQYIEIQAGMIVKNHPYISLRLIDEYFETGDEFFVSCAFCTQARAHCVIGNFGNAVDSYKRALEWEKLHPGMTSNARIELPILVSEKKIRSEYEFALNILTDRFTKTDHVFANTRYLWNGSCALIYHERGHYMEAREFAERALRAATETQSPFQYHRSIGLVEDTSDEFGIRVKRIARPSMVRSLLRSVSGS